MTHDTTSKTVVSALAHAAASHRKTAYIDQGVVYSWQQVDQMATQLAQRLRALGLRQGDRIGIILPNSIEWVVTYFAAAKMGAVVVGLSVRYRDSELDFMLSDSRVSLVLAPRVFSDFDYERYLGAARTRVPTLRHALFVDAAGAMREDSFPALLDAAERAVDAEPGAAANAVPAPDDLLMIIYTSGTTGRPKAAGLTHRSQLASARAQCAHTRLVADDLVQLAMPLNHVGGITCGVLSMLLAGAACELVPAFNPEVVLTMTRQHPPTMLVGVPTMLTLLLMQPTLTEADFSRLRLIIVGGSNVEPALLTRLQTTFPSATIMNLYGLSESSGAIVMTPWQASPKALLQSIGTPLDGAELRVVAPDGRAVASPEIGELWFRGAGVIDAYVGTERDTSAFDADGWLHTGDLGYVDEQGLVHLMGRQKDMFIQGGFNVYPAEVEGVISAHPGVTMAAGIGVPDPVLGEVGRYYVVPRPDVALTESELQVWCRERLADYKVPRQIVIRQQLPLTPAGKIHKAVLRDEAASQAPAAGVA